MTTPLEASVRSDLEAIVMMSDRAGEDSVRRTSNELRRLLVNDRTLDRLRKASGVKHELWVTAVDMSGLRAPSVEPLIRCAMAGGARIEGVGVHAGFVLNEGRTPVDGLSARSFTLSSFLESTCLMLRVDPGQSPLGIVSRRSLIKYVANKLGGIHYDETRPSPQSSSQSDRKEAVAYAMLDRAMASSTIQGRGTIFGMKHAYYELLAVAQATIASESIMGLVGLEPIESPIGVLGARIIKPLDVE